MIRHGYRLLVISLALALGAAGAGMASAQSGGEIPSVYPTVGAPGARFSFIVSGFRSRERVAVWVNYPDGRVSDQGIENLDRATRQGRVSWNWTAPKEGPLGTYQMVARSLGNGAEQVISFEVRETPVPIPNSANIEPKVGHGGNLFTFYATGFLLREDVLAWVNTPDGKPTPIDLELKRLNNGRIDGSWVAPTNAQEGRWQLVLRGADSGIEQVLNFEIRRPS